MALVEPSGHLVFACSGHQVAACQLSLLHGIAAESIPIDPNALATAGEAPSMCVIKGVTAALPLAWIGLVCSPPVTAISRISASPIIQQELMMVDYILHWACSLPRATTSLNIPQMPREPLCNLRPLKLATERVPTVAFGWLFNKSKNKKCGRLQKHASCGMTRTLGRPRPDRTIKHEQQPRSFCSPCTPGQATQPGGKGARGSEVATHLMRPRPSCHQSTHTKTAIRTRSRPRPQALAHASRMAPIAASTPPLAPRPSARHASAFTRVYLKV